MRKTLMNSGRKLCFGRPPVLKWGQIAGWLVFLALAAGASAAEPGFLQIRNGYFWDPGASNYFIPRGFAHQTWNPPVYANQSFDQIEYDLIEFKKMRANSVRVDLVWGEMERAPGVYDWSKPDRLFQMAEEIGLKLFVLIGYQYPPAWFPEEWRGFNDRGLPSNVINYEHPEARRVYTNHLAAVTQRYKSSKAVAGWIIGNEYAYFDLWEPFPRGEPHRMLGYDPISKESFRRYVTEIHQNDIAVLNAKWGTNFISFDQVQMPQRYPANRGDPAYHDLLQWRKKSIGDFVAIGAVAARQNDPNHLLTYSMIGLVFSEDDDNNTCEDAKSIVDSCRRFGAPLDFWAVNNYGWSKVGSELRTADFGVAKYQASSGLPVLLTETGHTETETFYNGARERHPKTVPSSLWEALMSGAVGVHLFHWSDRDSYVGDFAREKGFGIVSQGRIPKEPVYANVLEFFRRMEGIKVDTLLGGSKNPPNDSHLFWTVESDMGWPRANYENANLWGALRRLGYQPGLIDDDQFEAGEYAQGSAIILSRAFQMNPAHFRALWEKIIPQGIHIYANADLPGQFNAYHIPNPEWPNGMRSLFGLDVSQARAGWDAGISGDVRSTEVHFSGVSNLGELTRAYQDDITTWKVWHGVRAVDSGVTIVNHTGADRSQPPTPALVVKSHGRAKTAVNTFALGDTSPVWRLNPPETQEWDIRTTWLRSIFRNHFGMVPVIDLSGSRGARYVVSDYRLCADGGIVISLLNEHTVPAPIVLSAPTLLAGKTVENLTYGGIIESNSDGRLNLDLPGDEFLMLYVYPSTGQRHQSVINPDRNKLWFQSEPLIVWPNRVGYEVTVGYDTDSAGGNLRVSLERVGGKTYGFADPVSVAGQGTRTVRVPIAGAHQDDFFSSRKGAEFVWRAWLEKGGTRTSETVMPVRLSWGARPLALPAQVIPGGSHTVAVEWEELPSFAERLRVLPLNRAELWESLAEGEENYQITLEARSGGQAISKATAVTSQASAISNLTVQIPATATGPFTWAAYAEPILHLATHDLRDGFEGRQLGALSPRLEKNSNAVSYLFPWSSYNYPQGGPQIWWDEGVALQGSRGSQSAFVVVTNQLLRPLEFPGFGLSYVWPAEWSLPENPADWTNVIFSADFRLATFQNCVIELQLKNQAPGDGHWIQYSQPYQPGSNGWQTISAPVSQFAKPFWSVVDFDPTKIREVVVNIVMLDSNAVYEGYFDNILLDGPDQVVTLGAPLTLYDSALELVPPVCSQELKLSLRPGNTPGQWLLSWSACAGRRYAVQSRLDLNPASRFEAVPGLGHLSAPGDQTVEVTLPPEFADRTRFFRIEQLP